MAEDDTEYIKLKVVRDPLQGETNHPDGEIHFKMKQTAQMGKLMKSYSERVRVPIRKLWFLFDGRRINDGETPKDLEMKQDDVIVVHQAEDERFEKMAEDDTEYIKLKVVRDPLQGETNHPDGEAHEILLRKIHFKMKQTAQMGNLMKSYSERVRVPIRKLCFLFDGRRINDGETPKDLEMKQDDVIVVHQKENLYTEMEGPSYSEMREQNLYTDAVVKSGSGRQWNVHKNVMSRLGSFICNAFSFPTFDGTLNLAFSDEVVQIIIDLAYEGTCHINTENVFDALTAALMYQLRGLITGCVTFVLKEMISSKHIIPVKIFIGIHQAELEVTTDGALMDVVDKWFRKNFIDIYEDREMLKLSFEQMEHIANCDDLNIPEEELLRFLLKYVTSKGLDREKTIQLLATVRQKWINPSKLSSILQENQDLQEEIEKSKDVKNHPNARYPRDLVIVFGSNYDDDNVYPEVFNIRKNEWTKVEPSVFSTRPISEYRNCVISGNIIYELGIQRQRAFDIRDGRCYEVEYLRLPNNVLLGDLPVMNSINRDLPVVAWNGGIVAFLDSKVAMFYDPKENQWSPFPAEEIGGRYATRVDVNGILFSIGGDDDIGELINSIEYYDAESNTWILCGYLKEIVGYNKAAVVDGKVYVFPHGPMVYETDEESDGDQPDVECFKPVYENGRMSLDWFPPIQTQWRGRYGFQASVVDNKILITGKKHFNEPNADKDCHLLCPRTGEWSRVADLLAEKSYHKAVTVNTSELEVDRIEELCSGDCL